MSRRPGGVIDVLLGAVRQADLPEGPVDDRGPRGKDPVGPRGGGEGATGGGTDPDRSQPVGSAGILFTPEASRMPTRPWANRVDVMHGGIPRVSGLRRFVSSGLKDEPHGGVPVAGCIPSVVEDSSCHVSFDRFGGMRLGCVASHPPPPATTRTPLGA